ncbi:unnamed protein product [Microthlaspi erraticum]|uniref:Uncharacterized protein n=1 Tax=Microthlaspi erraticum TaxID=1685480 RepID=A0A6D2JQ54_9BRAS|nr:unnamed protein product [Microthlaspi erraticum]
MKPCDLNYSDKEAALPPPSSSSFRSEIQIDTEILYLPHRRPLPNYIATNRRLLRAMFKAKASIFFFSSAIPTSTPLLPSLESENAIEPPVSMCTISILQGFPNPNSISYNPNFGAPAIDVGNRDMTHLPTPLPQAGAVFNRSLDHISLILAVIASEAAKTPFSPSSSRLLTDTIPGAIQLPK